MCIRDSACTGCKPHVGAMPPWPGPGDWAHDGRQLKSRTTLTASTSSQTQSLFGMSLIHI
eukprot:835777-Pyramimonas_sp.AAC.1